MKKIFTKKVFLGLLFTGSIISINFSCSSEEEVVPQKLKARTNIENIQSFDEPQDPHDPDKPKL